MTHAITYRKCIIFGSVHPEQASIYRLRLHREGNLSARLNVVGVHQVEKRTPALKLSVTVVKAAAIQVNTLNNKLHDQNVTIARLSEEFRLAAADVQTTRERADRLEARFAQVR